jgi:hypothetical protein
MPLLFKVTKTDGGEWVGVHGRQEVTPRAPAERKDVIVQAMIDQAKAEWARSPPGYGAVRVTAPDDDGVERIVWQAGEAIKNPRR